uniref:All trans-polyprenyl-diphosphate synthase PDSS1 n=1 Tax=Anopheles culicifacies TaxID=139723 RepID=A0A182MTW1_9DIPT
MAIRASGSRTLMLVCRSSNTLFRPIVACRTKTTTHNRWFGIGSPFEIIEKCTSNATLRRYMHNMTGSQEVQKYNAIDPYVLLKDDLEYIYEDIRNELKCATTHPELNKMAAYYLDGQGKAFRPMITILMAKALNYHVDNVNSLMALRVSGSRTLMLVYRSSNTLFRPIVACRTKTTTHNRWFGIGSPFEIIEKCTSNATLRRYMHNMTGSQEVQKYNAIDPYVLLKDDLEYIYEDIRNELKCATTHPELNKMAAYYLDGQGKAFRPMITILMAKALNYHVDNGNNDISNEQRKIAMVSEMIHTASLVHDDVIDQSFARRGKPSVNVLWNHKQLALAGDFILAVTSMLLARQKHDEVTYIFSQILTDLVQGEFMQLYSAETENDRFAHYFTKTYRKTASLIANSLKAAAVLAGVDNRIVELSYQYGRNIGLAFQLVDDLLDFVSSSEVLGKPVAIDLKLGLATAPVLFACEEFPELNPMIHRRFREPGDVERAFELVHLSQGFEQTRYLVKRHCLEARRLASQLCESPYQKGLIVVSDFLLKRIK